jgi:4'-phosphopantetheinyl transferase
MDTDSLSSPPSPVWRPAPAEPDLADGEIHVWRVFLDHPRAASELAWLDSSERERSARLGDNTARRRFASAHIAKRKLLAAYLGLSPAELRFTVADKGKPSLDRSSVQSTPLEFNLSHSAGLALLAVSRDRPLGVDVEKLKPIDRILRIAERVFPTNLLTRLKALPPERQTDGFFRAWTEFEARQKLSGEGLFGAKAQVSEMNSEVFSPAPGFSAALAWPRGVATLRFFVVDDSEDDPMVRP